MCKTVMMTGNDFRKKVKEAEHHFWTARLHYLVLIFVLVSLFHDLDEERAFAFFANELFVFTRIQFTGTQWAKRDFALMLS